MNMTSNQKWRKNNSEAYKAHWIVANAIRYGKLKKESCVICENPRTHAHHDNYSEPLKIKWLCSKCHRAHHTLEKGQVVGGRQYIPKPRMIKRQGFHFIAKSLKQSGLTYSEIGKELGLSKSHAFKTINQPNYK